MSTPDVLIVGGGVSGLATAYYLGRHGLRSVILEKDRPGGLIRTDIVTGCKLEAGPDSYLAAKPAVAELAQDLGELGQQIISSNDARRRVFVVRHSKLIPFPRGMVMMVPSDWKFRSHIASLQLANAGWIHPAKPPYAARTRRRFSRRVRPGSLWAGGGWRMSRRRYLPACTAERRRNSALAAFCLDLLAGKNNTAV